MIILLWSAMSKLLQKKSSMLS
jgi:hypothetical protein